MARMRNDPLRERGEKVRLALRATLQDVRVTSTRVEREAAGFRRRQAYAHLGPSDRQWLDVRPGHPMDSTMGTAREHPPNAIRHRDRLRVRRRAADLSAKVFAAEVGKRCHGLRASNVRRRDAERDGRPAVRRRWAATEEALR